MSEDRILWQKQQERVRLVRRPAVNPFHNPLVEEDFYRRASAVVKHYYDFSPENTKKPFVLSSHCHMGKTAFWAFVYYYYLYGAEFCDSIPNKMFPNEPRPLIDNNLAHFRNLLVAHVGEEVVGTRPAILKNVQSYHSHHIESDAMPEKAFWAFKEQKRKYQQAYHLVVELWESLSPALPQKGRELSSCTE